MRKPLITLPLLLVCGLNITAQNQSADTLSENRSRLLNEVVVSAKKVNIREEGMNYTISNIQGSDLADAGTILDMMAWTPGLSLDSSRNIQVFGVSGTPLVYINGVKVSDKEKLELLSSNTVKKVEVIREPGAEYPSGTTSVIKITTTVPLKDIVNANLIESANQRRRFSNRITANMFGSFGKFDFLASGGYYKGNGKQSSLATESIYAKDETLLRDVSTSQTDLIDTSRWNWLAGATYHLSKEDEIQVEYSGNTSTRHRDFISEITSIANGASQQTDFDSRNRSTPDNHTLLANYTHSFSASTLNVNATYNLKKSDNLERVFLMPEIIENENNRSNSTYKMWTFQSDYSWKFRKRDRQTIGVYFGRSENESKADYTLMGVQNVNGSVTWGEFFYSSYWEFKGYGITPGVRIRQEKQESSSSIDSENTHNSKSYFNIVPQLSIYHRFTKKFAMNVFYKYSYSLPSFSDLSPAVTLSNLIYYKTGNPDLKIPRRHNLAMVFNLPSFTVITEYTSLRNSIEEITTPIEGTEYFLERPVNMNGNYYITLRGNYSLNIRNKFRLYAGASVQQTHTEFHYLDNLQKRNKIFTMASLNASYSLRPNLSFFMSTLYTSPQLVGNTNMGYTCNISFGGNLSLMKSKLSLRLAVDDILARSVTPSWKEYSPNLYRTRINRYDTRGVSLTATYKFTLAKKKYSELDNADDYDRM